MNKRLFIIFLASIILISCKRNSSSHDVGDITVIKFEKAPSIFRLSDRFKEVSCVQLEMTEESVLGRVQKIMNIDGKLVVLSDNEIFAFNKADGKYIGRIGNVGEGPEEYLYVRDIYYNEEEQTIVVCDYFKNELVSYKLNGDFVDRKKSEIDISRMQSVEYSPNGNMLMCNELFPGAEYAFTFRNHDGEKEMIDPFSPVYVEGYSTAWAEKPMTLCGEEIKFNKILNDTIFSIKDIAINPLYKLDFGKERLTKSVAEQMGSYGYSQNDYCLNNNVLTGINKMYETSEYIVLFPYFEQMEGYYWIDKKDDKGYHVTSSNDFDNQTLKVAKGRSIIQIVGSDENEIISCFDADTDAQSFVRGFDKTGKDIIFTDEVVLKIRNIDIEGNPFLLIYSH